MAKHNVIKDISLPDRNKQSGDEAVLAAIKLLAESGQDCDIIVSGIPGCAAQCGFDPEDETMWYRLN